MGHGWESALDYAFEDDDGNVHTVTVRYCYEPGAPPRKHGHPDDWHDGDGPEIDVMELEVAGKVLDKSAFARFLLLHADAIERQIIEAESRE